MSAAKLGKHKILAFRLLKDAKQKKAVKLALQLEHTIKKERETNVTQTKDGPVVTAGGLETTIEITALSTRDEVNLMLEKSVETGDKLEIWEIDLSSKGSDGKYDALYMQGNLKSWETPANVDDPVEISTEASIDGVPVAGKVSLTDEQQTQINYAFRDLDVYSGV